MTSSDVRAETVGGERRLRVVHCVGFYFPETTGGTEVYVRDLVQALSRHSIEGTIVAATNGGEDRYQWQGVDVVRYRPDAAIKPGGSDGLASSNRSLFQNIVAEAAPNIFHLHSWTPGAGLISLRQAAQMGIPCIVTVHVPSALCLRGTMLLHGKRPCDGHIEEMRCAQCWAEFRGLPAPAAWLVSHLPRRRTDDAITLVSPQAAALLSVRTTARLQGRDFRSMATLARCIVAPSQWVRAALELNAVPAGKIVVSPQAASTTFAKGARGRRGDGDRQDVVIGFVGRLESYKGADLLMKAFTKVPRDLPVRLLVAGTGKEPRYTRMLARIAGRDPRIEMVGFVEHEDVPKFLEALDVLAVPSRYMETGPLVALEAQALGIPVMGANLGGIAERVRDGVDGWLLPFDDPQPWTDAIVQATTNRAELARLSSNQRRTRTVEDVALDMATLYRDVMAGRAFVR